MGANDGVGSPSKPHKGLLNDCADGVFRYQEGSKDFVLQQQENVFEGNFSLSKEEKIFYATLKILRLFEKEGPVAILELEDSSEEEKYQIILPFTKKEGNRIIFANKSALFGPVEVEVYLFST